MHNFLSKKKIQESKIHNNFPQKNFFLGSLEKNMIFAFFFIDFRQELAYNSACMEWVSPSAKLFSR